MRPWAIELLANQYLLYKRRENLVRNFEPFGNCDAKTTRLIVIDCLNEDKEWRIGSMELRTGDHRDNRSRFVDIPCIVRNRAGSGEKGKL
jgi:hypothetical protein